ncbi:UbiA family prenyltransferase [Pseudomonas sp. FEN]|uniref:UbiA family prenyltransferase n=1 Tax=Pseudomonas sp. FEN TaxID=2767468 RepID=UPI00174BF4FE|nr:UbiA family prenyltransferase [Pseudomonas sp. FEN]
MAVIPFVVDLDGTLLRSDLLLESGMAFVRSQPLNLFRTLSWLRQGKAHLKAHLAGVSEIDVSLLPYDPVIISMIEEQRRTGRRVVLATASHHFLVDRIAGHLALFDQVLSSSAERNLSGTRKRDVLVELYGEKGFDYVGNSRDDLVVWRSANLAYVVNPLPGVERAARSMGNVEQVIHSRSVGFKVWSKALRIHQWVKNALIFVPLLAAHQLGNLSLLWKGVLAFLLFGLCASGVYILNDLLDLGDDRRHPTKHRRPFASGELSIQSGLVAFPILLAIAFGGAIWLLPGQFSTVLVIYYLLTLGYSLALKRVMALDVVALALLYTLRIVAGSVVFGLELTVWILAFSMFMFLSLALVKRYSELSVALSKGNEGAISGRDYFTVDLEMLSSMGTASGYLSVLVLVLYIHDGGTLSLYSHPQFIWLACPLLLFWITRIWILTHRGLMNEDPVVFALHDYISLAVGGLFCLIFWMAI